MERKVDELWRLIISSNSTVASSDHSERSKFLRASVIIVLDVFESSIQAWCTYVTCYFTFVYIGSSLTLLMFTHRLASRDGGATASGNFESVFTVCLLT